MTCFVRRTRGAAEVAEEEFERREMRSEVSEEKVESVETKKVYSLSSKGQLQAL
jgi:hypothetical protein